MSTQLPGFTAEAGLEAPAGRYQQREANPAAAAAGYLAQARRAISPRGRRTEPCIPNCLCVTQEGCPCCDSVPVTLPPRGTGRRFR
jgi:hypothetical protein